MYKNNSGFGANIKVCIFEKGQWQIERFVS